jgi:catechol 2,3-dioxygenase-like lactoylglutathione lyase family enzyme
MTDGAKLDSLDHVAIAVPDVAAAVEWYRERFRCEIAYQDDTWALLAFANTRLALVVPEQHPPHVGFVSPEAESFGDLQPHRDGTRSCYVEDPAGNAVEVLAPYDA